MLEVDETSARRALPPSGRPPGPGTAVRNALQMPFRTDRPRWPAPASRDGPAAPAAAATGPATPTRPARRGDADGRGDAAPGTAAPRAPRTPGAPGPAATRAPWSAVAARAAAASAASDDAGAAKRVRPTRVGVRADDDAAAGPAPDHHRRGAAATPRDVPAGARRPATELGGARTGSTVAGRRERGDREAKRAGRDRSGASGNARRYAGRGAGRGRRPGLVRIERRQESRSAQAALEVPDRAVDLGRHRRDRWRRVRRLPDPRDAAEEAGRGRARPRDGAREERHLSRLDRGTGRAVPHRPGQWHGGEPGGAGARARAHRVRVRRWPQRREDHGRRADRHLEPRREHREGVPRARPERWPDRARRGHRRARPRAGRSGGELRRGAGRAARR